MNHKLNWIKLFLRIINYALSLLYSEPDEAEAPDMGLGLRKPGLGICEQQRRRLISTLVIRILESVISKLATGEVFRALVSVAEETAEIFLYL